MDGPVGIHQQAISNTHHITSYIYMMLCCCCCCCYCRSCGHPRYGGLFQTCLETLTFARSYLSMGITFSQCAEGCPIVEYHHKKRTHTNTTHEQNYTRTQRVNLFFRPFFIPKKVKKNKKTLIISSRQGNYYTDDDRMLRKNKELFTIYYRSSSHPAIQLSHYTTTTVDRL